MAKKDELDRRRAAAYAWGRVPPDDEQKPAETDDAANSEVSAEATEQYRKEALRACGVLAAGIDRAFSLPESQQATAVAPLLFSAKDLGLRLMAIQEHPLQSVRLLRLAVRCHEQLSPDAQQAARAAAVWLDYDHAEAVDLLVEVALASDHGLASLLFLPLRGGKELTRIPGVSARFARIVDEGPTYAARYIALGWLSLTCARSAIPTLRRALRVPHFNLRGRALAILNRDFPDAILADDVLFLVADGIAHPPPEDRPGSVNFMAFQTYPHELEAAVVRIHPPGVVELLKRIVDGNCVRSQDRNGGIDMSWALRVLAAVCPEETLTTIDTLFTHVHTAQRLAAVQAATRLPDDLAWPRLLVGAADGVPEVATVAREHWLARRGTTCPIDELAGLESELLDGPPDERLRSRIAILRSGPLTARAAMVEVLFGEAPDPAALVLLLFAAQDRNLWEGQPRPSLPDNRIGYCREIIRRFGAVGVAGLVALAKRHPEGRRGWLFALWAQLGEGVIPVEAYPFLRAGALRRFKATPGQSEFDVLAILARVGAPAEIFDELWDAAMDPDASPFVRQAAAEALASIDPNDSVLDNTAFEEMVEAYDALDLRTFQEAAAIAVCRDHEGSIELLLRAVEEQGACPPGDPDDTEALAKCIVDLARVQRLPSDWLDNALRRPGTRAFVIAAQRVTYTMLLEEETILRDMLRSPFPSAAVASAIALLAVVKLRPSDPILFTIAAAAPLSSRAEILVAMMDGGVPSEQLWPLLEDVLVSDDPRVTSPFHALMSRLTTPRDVAKLARLRARVNDPVIAAEIDESLGIEAADAYWREDPRPAHLTDGSHDDA